MLVNSLQGGAPRVSTEENILFCCCVEKKKPGQMSKEIPVFLAHCNQYKHL